MTRYFMLHTRGHNITDPQKPTRLESIARFPVTARERAEGRLFLAIEVAVAAGVREGVGTARAVWEPEPPQVVQREDGLDSTAIIRDSYSSMGWGESAAENSWRIARS